MRSIITLVLAMVFLGPCLSVSAAPRTDLSLPKEGHYYYWLSYTDVNGAQATSAPREFREKETTVDLPTVKDVPVQSSLYVLDADTGNEAVTALIGKVGQTFPTKLNSSDFSRVRRVEVDVTSASDEPVAAAAVKMEGAGKAEDKVLDPSAQGTVVFSDVPSGTAKVTVEYGEGKSSSQDVDISLDRKTPVLVIKVPIVGDIETVQATGSTERGAAEKSGASSEGKETSAPRPIRTVSFGSGLVGIIILVVILYIAYLVLRSRGATIRKALKNMGVDLPEEQAPSAPFQPAGTAPVDPTICPFCGGKKDPVTGACACTVGGVSASASSGGSGPRLIATQGAYAGTIYQIASGDTAIGREDSNTIAFPQDTTVSRRHARVSNSGGQLTIYDLGSSNGTFVNGVKITEQALRPGDEVQIGATRMRFEA